jgi:hypothetical protein
LTPFSNWFSFDRYSLNGGVGSSRRPVAGLIRSPSTSKKNGSSIVKSGVSVSRSKIQFAIDGASFWDEYQLHEFEGIGAWMGVCWRRTDLVVRLPRPREL